MIDQLRKFKIYWFFKFRIIHLKFKIMNLEHRLFFKIRSSIEHVFRTIYVYYRLRSKGYEREEISKIYFRWLDIDIVRLKKHSREMRLNNYKIMQDISETMNIPMYLVRGYYENI